MNEEFLPNTPVVIRNKIKNWKILKYNEKDWIEEFQDKVLSFRQGTRGYKMNPYWEHLCQEKKLTMEQFFEHSATNKGDWLYFDYKYLKEIFLTGSNICESIKWSDLYLPNCQSADSTLWIGNKGAHTPCHMDTYGCNFVAQIFGRKLWILMPPEETEVLNPIRIPYEESSIYSSYNFFTPNNNLLKKGLKKAFKIILSPGEVLFIPRHWWHYVENIEVAISINMWIPLDVDHESRLEECLIRHYVSSICQDLTKDEALCLLNPNEGDLLKESDLIETLQKCLENCIRYRKGEISESSVTQDLVAMLAQELKQPYQPQKFDLERYIYDKSQEYEYNADDFKNPNQKITGVILLAKSLINWFGQPKNLGNLKENLLTEFSFS